MLTITDLILFGLATGKINNLMMKPLKTIIVSSAFLVLAGCNIGQSNDSSGNIVLADTLTNFSVKADTSWTNRFYRKQGWFGADGVFSLAPDGRESIGAGRDQINMLYFSDTMTGVVHEDSVEGFKMVNNSVAYINGLEPLGESLEILTNRDERGEYINFFTPNTAASKANDYYWFGDAFVNQELNNDIYIFGYRTIDHSEKSWDFEIVGTTLVIIPAGEKPPFANAKQIDSPFMVDRGEQNPGKGTLGSAVYVNTKAAGAPDPDGYIYVYGLLEPNKQLVVGRVKPADIEEFDKWQYWQGEVWGSDMTKLATITDRVSNEVSITPLKDGRYLLVFQEDGIGEYVSIRIGESPIGPFGPIQRIWHVPELSEPPGIIPYNAKAHPVLSSDEEGLLISYNTITLDYFNDILKYPHSYRPRFIRLKINQD